MAGNCSAGVLQRALGAVTGTRDDHRGGQPRAPVEAERLDVHFINADFRRLKFTHNDAHVLKGVPGTRQLQCEVFSPLPLGIAESHCIRLPGSFARPLKAMMR
jgi:hypothetical protein